MDVVIRQETIKDHKDVFELNRIAFGQDGEARLVEALRKSEAFIPELSLVASLNNDVVGYILFTKIIIRNDNGNQFDSLALAPMAVKPDIQKKGIGALLIKDGLKKATELAYKSVIVLGHEKYYPRFGFLPAEKWDIKTIYDVPSDVFMGIELITDGLKNVSGTVIYPKAFELV